MNQFLAVMSLLSAYIMFIILTTSNYKKEDRTWKSFSQMVFLYISYDIFQFIGAIVDNSLILSFTNFTSVCLAVLAIFEFHFYLVCFFKEKKFVDIPDTTGYVGVFGIFFLVLWTVFNIAKGRIGIYAALTVDRVLGYLRLMMIIPDFFFVWRRKDQIGILTAIAWCSHLLVPSMANFIDAGLGTKTSFVMITISVLLIYIIINQETEMDIIRHKIDLEKKEMDLQDVRRNVMISQIQPHFIYNVLNIICILCRRDPKEAARTTRLFARYLKLNVESLKKNHPVPFDEEMQHADTYLKLEKVRFRDELEISYEIGPRNFCIPALSLQPMVENAVKHGLCMKEDGVGHLTISTKEDGTNWYIIVSDDGIGYDTKAKKKEDGRTHIGVENTKMRIEMMCHGTMETFSVKGKGTNVVMTIPKLYDSNCLKENRVWEREEDL